MVAVNVLEFDTALELLTLESAAAVASKASYVGGGAVPRVTISEASWVRMTPSVYRTAIISGSWVMVDERELLNLGAWLHNCGVV